MCLGATLPEVVISLAVASIGISGVVGGYIVASRRVLWSTCATAAQTMALNRLEQTRACRWDPIAFPPLDELASSNFPVTVLPLDIPINGNSVVMATNTTTIANISQTPPVRLVRVDCVWSLPGRGPFTNSMISYRSPDQ